MVSDYLHVRGGGVGGDIYIYIYIYFFFFFFFFFFLSVNKISMHSPILSPKKRKVK